MAVQQLVERRHDTGEIRIPPGLIDQAVPRPWDSRGRPVLVRRRRIVLVLVGLTALAAVVAVGTGAVLAWLAVVAAVLVGATYLGLLHRLGRMAAEREFADFLSPDELDVATIFGSVAVASDTEVAPQLAPPQSETWALVRFAVANLAGWALAPLVFALTLLMRQTPRDATGQRWLANLKAVQERLHDQSLRTLAISAATTASVTAAGTVTALVGGAPASAATITATAPVMTATTSSSTIQYRVVAGDTVGAIAERFGTSSGAIIAASHLRDPNLIFPGQLLTVPGVTRTGTGGWGAPARPGSTYTVVAGDTVGAIAARFGTSVGAIVAANHLSDPNLILPGQVLIISAGTGGSDGGGGSAGAPAPGRGSSYRVVAGDTVGAIAARFGTSVGAIVAANHLSDPNLIFVGQALVIPGGGGGVAPIVSPREPSPAPAPAPATSAAAVAVEVALAQVGKPYQWAGAGPNSYDCSGLVQYAWGRAGVYLPHYSVSQYEDTQRIGASQLEPGDLVFYDTGSGAQPNHVTIYIGGGRIITADSPGTVVRVEVVDWDGVPMGYGRVR